MWFNIYVIKFYKLILFTNYLLHMKTLIWLIATIALSAFIFTATVNAANNLANKLEISQEKVSIQELMMK